MHAPCRALFSGLVVALTVGGAAAQAVRSSPENQIVGSAGGGTMFSLLPKSLQGTPRLDFSYFTEVTEAGRKSRTSATTQPVYYVGRPGNSRKPASAQTRWQVRPRARSVKR